MPGEGREHRQSNVVEGLKQTVGRFLGLGEFSEIESSGQYQALSDDEKNEVREYAKTLGMSLESNKTGGKKKAREKRQKVKRGEAPPADLVAEPDVVEPTDAVIEPEPAVVAVTPEPVIKKVIATPKADAAPATPEKKEAKPDWEFTGYTAAVVHEPRRDGRGMRSFVDFTCHITQHDGNKDIPNDYEAYFGFSPETYRQLKNDPKLLERAAVELTEMRREIDAEKVKVMLDPRKDAPGEFTPKWVYRFGGRRHNDPFTTEPDRGDDDERPFYERIPAEVIRLMKERPDDYHTTKEYLRWYRPAMASKREQVIGEEWERRLNAPPEVKPAVIAEPVAVAAVAPAKRPEPAKSGELWTKFGTADKPATLEDMKRGVRSIVADLGGVVTNIQEADDRLETVVQFALAGLRDQAKASGGRLPDSYEDVVREAAREALHGLVSVTDPERRIKLLTDDEARFLNDRGSLAPELRNGRLQVRLQSGEDHSRWVVSRNVENGREAEGMKETISLVVNDALEDVAIDDGLAEQSTAETQAKHRLRVSGQLVKVLSDYVSGPHRETRQGTHFRENYLDLVGKQVVIRDYDGLSRMIKRLVSLLR
jgi:hypothetical protein